MTRLGAFVALLMVSGPSLARDPSKGIEDRLAARTAYQAVGSS